MIRLLSAACFCALAGISSGCASYRAMPLNTGEPAHSRPYRQELHGVVLAADLVADAERTRALFYRILQDQGIVPVVLHLQNKGDRTLVLHRERICVRLENGEVFTPIDPGEVIAVSRTRRAWSYIGLPLVLPYLYIDDQIAAFNFELDQDYRDKSLPNYLRVAPGDRPTSRALFFRMSAESIQQLHRSPAIEVPGEVEALTTGERREPGEDVRFLLSLG